MKNVFIFCMGILAWYCSYSLLKFGNLRPQNWSWTNIVDMIISLVIVFGVGLWFISYIRKKKLLK